MDPNEVLAAARAAYARGDYEEAAHLYRDLDTWLTRRGFKPDAWNKQSLT